MVTLRPVGLSPAVFLFPFLVLPCRPVHGQTLVKDIDLTLPTLPSTGWLQSGAGGLVTYVASAWFLDSGSKPGLWRSDGTAAGTALVRALDGTPDSPLTVAGNILYFTATTAGSGRELWRSDGATAGTFAVEDINPGTGDGVLDPSGLLPPAPARRRSAAARSRWPAAMASRTPPPCFSSALAPSTCRWATAAGSCSTCWARS